MSDQLVSKMLATSVVISVAAAVAACDVGAPPVAYPLPTSAPNHQWRIELRTPSPFSTLSEPFASFRAAALAPDGGDAFALTWSALGEPPLSANPLGLSEFGFSTGLLHGPNDFRLTAMEAEGASASVVATVYYGGERPGLRVVEPRFRLLGPSGATIAALVSAPPGDPVEVAAVQDADGQWIPLRQQSLARWVLDGPLLLQSGAALELRASTASGSETRLSTPLVWDDAPPTLQLGPVPTVLPAHEPLITLSGTATDNRRLAALRVYVGDGAPLEVALDGQIASFEIAVSVPAGPTTLIVALEDGAGNQSTFEQPIYRTRALTLGPPRANLEPVSLQLDRFAVQSLIPEDQAKALTLLNLDLLPLLQTALQAASAPQQWGIDTSAWGQAEWNLHGLLTMTPDTAKLAGTSMAPLISLSSSLGIAAPTVLAELTQVGLSEPFLPPQLVAQVVAQNLISTHPAIEFDPSSGRPVLPISLHDALTQLEGVGSKLGQTASHPGIVKWLKAGAVLEPHFMMRARAVSALTEYDGVDLSAGKAQLFRPPTDGPWFTLDVDSPDSFELVGVASEPSVSLALVLLEDPNFIAAGTEKSANQQGAFFKGSSAVWDKQPWVFERVVADAAFDAYHALWAESGYQFERMWSVGAVANAATMLWDRGWLTITTSGGVGSPPPPQYIWDTLTEIAQVRLHDGGLEEGKASLELVLNDIPIPLTAEQIAEAVRPQLSAQAVDLANTLVGDFSTYNSPCDIYLDQEPQGTLVLRFAGPAELPGASAPHPRPGFFLDAGLTQLFASASTPLSPLPPPLFAADRDNSIWRIEVISAPQNGPALVHLSPAEAP